jgi:hypothetical protein
MSDRGYICDKLESIAYWRNASRRLTEKSNRARARNRAQVALVETAFWWLMPFTGDAHKDGRWDHMTVDRDYEEWTR